MMPATTATHCPYCALQCGIHLTDGPAGLTVSGDDAFPVNKGALCVKGWSAPETLTHRDRLRTPLISNQRPLQPARPATGTMPSKAHRAAVR
jgi:assimilatory nitrate reductase catalytic subunit